MARVLGPLLLVVAVVGGYLWYQNQGKSTTVTAPPAGGVGDRARQVGGGAVHGTDSFVQTHAAQIGYVLAFLLLGGLLWAIWTKLGKGWLILLVVVALVATGVFKFSH